MGERKRSPLSPRRAATLLATLAALAPLAGCSSEAHVSSHRELALQRAQFVQVSDGLRAVLNPVHREVSASRAAWPLISNGLPPTLDSQLRNAVALASAAASALTAPSFMAHAQELTGPAASIAGLYESYDRLSERGWRLTETTLTAIATGAPVLAIFARANSPLYIHSVYDAHFNLSLIGTRLAEGYAQLGGPSAFGPSLTQGEVNSLVSAYSIPAVRLAPHPGPGAEER
ncbi:MAG TPA: hypothetical protein VGI26_01315 [Solirubrobacteraceae bacterium]